MTVPIAEVSAATRRFGDLVAVDRVDMDLHPGETVGLLGANGAGKTTLIRMLLGLLRPSSGQITLFGHPPTRRTRARVGYVPQTLGLYTDLTAAENLAFQRAVFGRSGTAPAALDGIPDLPVGELSLGAQRRVAFAAALDHRPDLLVLDEPTSGVDPLACARLWETVQDATAAGAAALVTTHNMEEAGECDRLVVMAAGRVVATGTGRDIIGDATVTIVRAGAWERAFTATEEAGLPVRLAGTTLRIPGVSPADVEPLLAGIDAQVTEGPATLDERFFQLASAMGAPDEPGHTG